MSKRLSKCIASFDYFHNSLIALSVTNGKLLLHHSSFANIIGVPSGMRSASFSLAFSISTRILKKALVNNEISHEDFMTIISEEKNYRELKESIRMMNSQRSDTENHDLIEEDKNS